MQITFRASPELLKVGEIGESIVGGDDTLRLAIINRVAGALRLDWGKLPLRDAMGLKYPASGLINVKTSLMDTAKRRAHARSGTQNRKVDEVMKALSLKLEGLEILSRGSIDQFMQQESGDLQAKLHHWGLIKEQNIQNEEEIAQGEVADALDEFTLTYGYVLASELADWLRKEQGFDVKTAESSNAGSGELAQKLAKWFDKPICDLPQEPRSLAETYIPTWSELSGADRQARADEADRQVQAVRADRLEKVNREKEQAESDPLQVAAGLIAWYAQSLDAATWWNLSNIAPREAAMLLCRFNPHDGKLDPLSIVTDETGPDDFKRLLRVFEDVAQSQSQPRTLSDWHDVARDKRLKYHSWIDAFRQAVNAIAPTTAPPPQVPNESQEQTGTAHSGATEVTSAGITKREILAVDWPLYGQFNQDSLSAALSDVREWMKPARTALGSRGKASALWNPAKLADCLVSKEYAKQKALSSFIGKHFNEWLSEWEKLQEYR